MIFGSFYIHGKKIRHQEKKYTRAHTKIRLHTDARLFLSHFHWEEEDKSKDMSPFFFQRVGKSGVIDVEEIPLF